MPRSIPAPRALLAGGAVAVASVAYAIGSQAGGGTADAAARASSSSSARLATVGATGPQGRADRGHHRDLGALLTTAAKALGVSEAELRTALQELRPSLRGDRRDALAAALAKDLGVSAAAVTTALEAQRPQRGARFDALAGELGLSAAKVEAAFRAVKAERPGGRRAFLTALAGELGVTEAKLTQALGTVGPGRRGGPGLRGGHGPFGHGARGAGLDAAALARALDVPAADVRRALAAFRTTQRASREERFDALAAELAKKLGVSEAKVQQVAEDLLPRGFRGRP